MRQNAVTVGKLAVEFTLSVAQSSDLWDFFNIIGSLTKSQVLEGF